MRLIARLLLAVAVVLGATSCNDSNDQRVPLRTVRIFFITPGQWDVYGVSGATQWRVFTKSNPVQPAGFPYTALSATGFGGVLLVSDVLGAPMAYDLGCPVEAPQVVRIQVDTQAMVGRCPVCGSTFNIFYDGNALSGAAAENHWPLRRYRVLMPGPSGETAYITN